jgi:hypothetical protein
MVMTMRRTALIIFIALASIALVYIPLRCNAQSNAGLEMTVAGKALPAAVQVKLIEAGWNQRVGDSLGLWVSIERQRLVGIRSGKVEFDYVCSTAARGIGNRENSKQTPTGWHEIDERIGAGAPQGAIFVERKPTGKVWSPGEPTEKDYVLSRILWLRGLEPGLNAGKGIDSHDRFIYIHGTPAEEKLGQPASMGCIRLSNRDVVELFDRVNSGTHVLISEW